MTRQRKHHFKDRPPSDPSVARWSTWPPANRAFYQRFRRWLRDGGYSDSALNIYGCAARLALGWLDVPHWEIDPQADLDRVRAYVNDHYGSESTRQGYGKGLAKLAEFLRTERRQSAPDRPVNWPHYVGPLPSWLADDVRAYIAHRRRSWPLEVQRRRTISTLSHLTLSLRWMAGQTTLHDIADLNPDLWYDYVDHRLADGISPVTANIELGEVLMFLCYLAQHDRPVCERMLCVEPLTEEQRLPRDVPVEQLRRLLRAIEAEAASEHAGKRRMGQMDMAWFLLMLHSGLRSGEVRSLRRDALNLEEHRVRIDRAKGLKDRVVYLSAPAAEALRAYLDVRGDAPTDHVFVHRHKLLSVHYFGGRLRTYGQRCGVHVTPHQLRHSFATMLLNAGAPVEALQQLMGHQSIDTTLIYGRVYDRTVASAYYRAIRQVEGVPGQPANADLLALVDVLESGALDQEQQEAAQILRAAILALEATPGSE